MPNRRLVSVAAVSTSGTAYTGRADGMFSTNDQAKLKQAGVWPTAIKAPSAPTIGTATATSSGSTLQASVTFTAPITLNGETITSYTVTSSSGQTATGVSSPIIVSNLNSGTTPTFTVTANSASGSSAPSASSNSAVWVASGAPTIGTATAINQYSATVSFTAPANNGGTAITQYTATSSPGGFTGTLMQAGSGTITVTGLDPAGQQTYTFTVTATNATGVSAPSAASNSITTPIGAGSYTFANGFTGLSYQPPGKATVTLTLYGGGGASANNSAAAGFNTGGGSVGVKYNVPVSSLYIYTPNGVSSASQGIGGNGGAGGSCTHPASNGGYGGAICSATWSGGSMQVCGGGGSTGGASRTERKGGIEGTTYSTAFYGANNGTNGGSGAYGGCYYGGGGGGGGVSAGGYGGARNSGGAAGTGSTGYDSLIVGNNEGLGYAKISWT